MHNTIKLQRSGFTETNLIFINHLNRSQYEIDDSLKKLQDLDIQRLYSKAGFYDKNINGTYFDIDIDRVKQSQNFHKWLSDYETSLFNCDYLIMMSHIANQDIYKQHRQNLIEYQSIFLDKNNQNKRLFRYWTDNYSSSIYGYLENKSVLIVNSFASLIYQQYTSGNTHKIFNNFPVFSNIQYIDFPYTFFNTGPHSNFFETLDYYYNEILLKNFDIALISCGPYGCILVDKIVNNLKKTAITMGSGITPMFGIDPGVDKPYWINKIPEKYIPKDYTKIEKGRYWIGK